MSSGLFSYALVKRNESILCTRGPLRLQILPDKSRPKVSRSNTLHKKCRGGGYPNPYRNPSGSNQYSPVPPLYILVQNLLELLHNPVALQSCVELPIDIHRSLGLLKRPRQGNPDIGMLRLTWPIHDAAHHRQLQLLNTGILLLPLRHLLDKVSLNPLRQFLEVGRSSPSAPGATRHLRHKAPNPQRLQNL